MFFLYLEIFFPLATLTTCFFYLNLIPQRKRQQELNKIKISVILSMDQLQHFKPNDNYLDLSRAILFDANRLISLKDRVAQLNEETQETRRLHRINVVHLRRMNTDISFMRNEITRLESDIKQAMIKKFGMIVNLDELEEEVLRRYVFDLETSAEDEFRLIDKEIARKKVNYDYERKPRNWYFPF